MRFKNMIDFIKNKTIYINKYRTHSEAIIISCFFNPQKSPYRIKAFNLWYESIKHLNHKVIECVIGDGDFQLEENENIERVRTESLLWHKESLLNLIISELPKKYKYVFWVDADVLFTNKNWLVDGVKKLRDGVNLIQPFEYCVHLEQDELEPEFFMDFQKIFADTKFRHPKVWKSFGANHVLGNSDNKDYNKHGHVGFAWGARREILDNVPLYDRALIGGADHIIAHAGAGHINHSCISKSFTDDIDEVNEWSKSFYKVVQGKIGFVSGDLYHIWHGDIKKRDYLNRIKEFTKTSKNINRKDENGLYVADNNDQQYVEEYFKKREVTDSIISITKSTDNLHSIPIIKNNLNKKRIELKNQYPDRDDSFIESLIMAHITDSTLMGASIGGNEMLNDNDLEFGGGEFGGGGAGDTWNNDSELNETFS